MARHPQEDVVTPPLVSVILCGYNQGAFLGPAIESVLAQTYPNVELVIVDNGSTDDSRKIARSYATHANVRLVLREEGGTVTKRSNEGIAASTGDFVSFLYADDWYLPRKTEVQMEAFARLPADYGVVYSPGYRHHVDTGREWRDGTPAWSGWVLESMLRDYHRAWLNMDSPLARRECFLRFPFHEDVFQEGEGIYFRIATAYRFHPLPDPVVVMREHHSNLGKAYELQTRMNLLLLRRLEKEPTFPARLRPLVDRVHAASMRNLGWQMVRLANDPAKGRAYLLESLRWGVRTAVHPRLVAGLALTLLPRPVLRGANAVVNRIRRHRENVDVVTELGPGSEISRVPTS